MWKEIVSRSQEEKKFWREIVKSGKRYEGAELQFKELRSENAIYLYEVVKRNGWPSILECGEEINKAAYSIASASTQHPKEMKYFLAKLTDSAKKDASNPVHVVALTDRINYYEGKQQVCGMYLEWNVSGELYANVASIEEANIKRKELGLPSVQEAVQAHLKELESNPGSKPKDIAAHNKMHRTWAESVGW